MAEKRTDIKDLGEFGLIEKISENFTPGNDSTALGIGDDAALIKTGDQLLALSTDQMLEGIHFDLAYVPLKHLGFKAVATNVSDIAAMNAIPSQITVSVALSNRFSVEAVEALYEGIQVACQAYKVDLVGGDTSSSGSGLVINVAATGFVSPADVAKRSGASPGDILCVTGDLGAAYMGLQVLEREKQVYLSNPDMQPKLEGYDYLIQRQLRPEARMDIVHELRNKGIVPTSMIDISDGLASEIFHLSKQSKTGFRIFEDQIPIDQGTMDAAYEFKLDPTTCALNGGEDYELLFTISQDDHDKLKKHPDIHFIGHAQPLEMGNQMVTKGENIVSLQAQGWQHLSS